MVANATVSLSFATTSPSSSSSLLKHKPLLGGAAKRFVSCSSAPYHSLCLVAGRSSKPRVYTAFAAVVDEETTIVDAERENDGVSEVEERGKEGRATEVYATIVDAERENDGVSEVEERGKEVRATEVYVCNLPRSCDTEQLLHMFQPHGTVLSAEICRNAETGESKGSAYVTMGSINSAKNAVAALDGLDVGGREMRVRFSVQMNYGRRSSEAMNSSPKSIYYEGPHKVYVGNLARSARPEDVRHLFGRFGNVASVRVLQDMKQGKSRVYAFVSYLSQRERDAAMSFNGTEFCGRTLVVREGVEKTAT